MTALLEESLAALIRHLGPGGPRPLLCGGFGLVLRHQHLVRSGARTLMPLVSARSTEDLDLLLGEDIITDLDSVHRLRDALGALGYGVVPEARHFQFSREVSLFGQPRAVKFDLLALRPVDPALVKINGPRIRPHGARDIHARLTPEAFSAHDHPLATTLDVPGDPVQVSVVHPFTHIVMKLHALNDRINDAGSDFGRRHALDLYRLLAMTTEEDWRIASKLSGKYADEPAFKEARELASGLFLPDEGLGRLRLHEAARGAGVDVSVAEVAALLRDWLTATEGGAAS